MKAEKPYFEINGRPTYGIPYRNPVSWTYEFLVEYDADDNEYVLRWYRPDDDTAFDATTLCTYHSFKEGQKDLDILASSWEN